MAGLTSILSAWPRNFEGYQMSTELLSSCLELLEDQGGCGDITYNNLNVFAALLADQRSSTVFREQFQQASMGRATVEDDHSAHAAFNG